MFLRVSPEFRSEAQQSPGVTATIQGGVDLRRDR